MCISWDSRAYIEGFKICRPLIQIDGTFLYGKYKGKLLIATSVDPNGHIFPLTFAIVEEKSTYSWFWFLTTLKFHVTKIEEICLISDRHAGINAAVRDVATGWNPPHAHHRYCLRHVVSNFNEKYKIKIWHGFDVTIAAHGFHMDKGDNKQVVNLEDCKCIYNKWQSFSIPCSSVLTVCAHARIDS